MTISAFTYNEATAELLFIFTLYRGTFQMERLDGSAFDVRIPTFCLESEDDPDERNSDPYDRESDDDH